MSRQLKPYRVYLTSWDLWQIWIDASSADEAEIEAMRIYEEVGEDEFRHRNCGVEYAIAELDEEEAA